MPADNFAFDGQLAFLTYPQCGLTREELRDFLVGTLGVRQFCIARELHEDGSPHLHAIARWERRKRLVGSGCFDVGGHHPNVQRPRSLRDCLAYVRKEDSEYLDSEPPLVVPECRGDAYGELLSLAEGPDDFLARVGEQRPRDLVLYLERLQAFCRWKWPQRTDAYCGRARGEFGRELPVMTSWVEENLEVRMPGGPQSPPSLFIYPLMPIV